ncbi:MAG: type IX secretion system membrane protein PorP/SprF [Bacteroidetes bacterium]|nr:type IX secretion system membrane protein PorP/SprF [Bacteroidota bacterium]
MRKHYILLLLLSFVIIGKAQQDPQYNLYQFNQMVINPAYAGARDVLAVVASVRNQWTGFDGAPRTSCLSIHGPIMNKHLGLGLTVVSDKMGPRSMAGVYGNIAYIAQLSSKYKLSFGLNAGYNRFQFDFNKLNLKDNESSSAYFSQTQTYNKLDANGGLYLRSNTFFVGLSVTHLFNPSLFSVKDSSGTSILSYSLKTHQFFTMGKSFKLSDNCIFAPTIMFRQVNGKGNGDLNLNFFIYKKVWLGMFYRGGYGSGFLMQYYVTNKFRVAYSFDTGARDARKLGASHEVMLGFDFSGNTKSKVISPRFL